MIIIASAFIFSEEKKINYTGLLELSLWRFLSGELYIEAPSRIGWWGGCSLGLYQVTMGTPSLGDPGNLNCALGTQHT